MESRRHFALAALLAPGVLAWVACSSFSADEDAPAPGPDATTEASSPPTSDAALDASTDAPEDLLSFTDTKNWETHKVEGGDSAFTGAVFDGRYIVFSPTDGNFAQFDTTKSFDDDLAWKRFDTGKLVPKSAYGPGVMAGSFLYFPAWFQKTSAQPISTSSARLAVGSDFENMASWKTLVTVTGTNDAGLAPFGSAFVANGTVTFFPFAVSVGTDAPPPVFLQPPVSPTGDFADLTQWRQVPAANLGVAGPHYAGAAVVGDNVYSGDVFTQDLVQLKTSLDAAATHVSSAPLNGTGSAFTTFGMATDGRYVYFTPLSRPADTTHFSSRLARYDTTKDFGAPDAFDTFDLAVLDGAGEHGWCGATFDGRFVYLSPFGTTNIIRYDTTKEFGARGSYEAFSYPAAALHCGAMFDGQYVYFTPYASNLLPVRFKTRATRKAWPPPASNF